MPEGSKRAIGIWTEWEFEVAWTGEGLIRVVAFLVEGAAARDDVIFRLVTTPINFHAARTLLAGLSAREGEHWTLHTFPSPLPKDGAPIEAAAPFPSPELCEIAEISSPTSQYPCVSSDPLSHISPKQMRFFLVFIRGMVIVVSLFKTLLRPIWRYFWRNGLNTLPVRLRLLREAWADPMAAAPAIGASLRGLPFGLARVGKALENWRRSSTDLGPGPGPGLAAFANSHVEVDGWLLLAPSFAKALDLKAPKFVLFADALPFDFPVSYAEAVWGEGGTWTEWHRTVGQVLAWADGVIALSRHVATRHVARLFDVDPQKIKPIPLAAPDRRGDLPFLPGDRRRTDDSRRRAAEVLRDHAVRRRWPYLVGFPFDEIDYIAISTQDRVSKNIPIVIEAARRLIRRDHQNIKIFMTTILHENDPACRVPQSLRESRLYLDAVSMPELPNREHAAFYHCAAVTVHPSLFEGGDTALPFGESVGLGTPCLLAFGPHTAELLESYPELSPWVFDPYDADALARLIRETIADRERVLDRQMASYERMRERSWADVAGEYADVIIGRSQ